MSEIVRNISPERAIWCLVYVESPLEILQHCAVSVPSWFDGISLRETVSDNVLISIINLGAGDGIRTHDFNLGKVALYP